MILIATKLKRELTKDDQIAFMDYCTWYGVQNGEEFEYVDSFVGECYHVSGDEETGFLYELNDPTGLPFAHQVHKNGLHTYSWGGCTITKME